MQDEGMGNICIVKGHPECLSPKMLSFKYYLLIYYVCGCIRF